MTESLVSQQLPLWMEFARGVPNVALRSALFSAIGKGKRKKLEGQLITAVTGIYIYYTGDQLDQSDLDTWQTILHLARGCCLDDNVRVSAYELLKLTGKSDTGKNRSILEKRIIRLRSGTLRVKQGNISFYGGLIEKAWRDDTTQEWVIKLSVELRSLFESDRFTQIDWHIRQALSGKPLAQWLHGFYSSHAEPFDIKVETLLKLSGSGATEVRFFKRHLDSSMSSLAVVMKARGMPFEYGITKSNKVWVKRLPTLSQSRHITKKSRDEVLQPEQNVIPF